MSRQNVLYGNPLQEVTEKIKVKSPKVSIVFIIDGCCAKTLYDALDNDDMPELQNLINKVGGCTKYEKLFYYLSLGNYTVSFKHNYRNISGLSWHCWK